VEALSLSAKQQTETEITRVGGRDLYNANVHLMKVMISLHFFFPPPILSTQFHNPSLSNSPPISHFSSSFIVIYEPLSLFSTHPISPQLGMSTKQRGSCPMVDCP
jgi:hypothetical protein